MTSFEIAPPCHVTPPSGARAIRYSPWLEAAISLRVAVSQWRHEESAWVHWAVPAVWPLAAPRRSDPGRYAMVPGEPDAVAIRGAVRVGQAEACELLAAVLASWHPVLHRQPQLDLVSRLDEPRDEFRRRCLALLRPVLAERRTANEVLAARLAEVAAGVETITVGERDLVVTHVRVAVVWYPDGREPAVPAAELMTSGSARSGR